MSELIADLTTWLQLHPQWIAATIALMALIESLVMVGIIVPGVAILFTISLLAGALNTNLYLCLFSAMAGAVCGDLASFFLGRHAHPWALNRALFRRHPDWIERGEDFFQRYGIYSVVIGRFVGPVRPVVPFVAGMLSMKPILFIGVNLLSALAWAPVYILPGYLLGESADGALNGELEQYSDTLSLAVAGIVIVGLGLIYVVARLLKTQSKDKSDS